MTYRFSCNDRPTHWLDQEGRTLAKYTPAFDPSPDGDGSTPAYQYHEHERERLYLVWVMDGPRGSDAFLYPDRVPLAEARRLCASAHDRYPRHGHMLADGEIELESVLVTLHGDDEEENFWCWSSRRYHYVGFPCAAPEPSGRPPRPARLGDPANYLVEGDLLDGFSGLPA